MWSAAMSSSVGGIVDLRSRAGHRAHRSRSSCRSPWRLPPPSSSRQPASASPSRRSRLRELVRTPGDRRSPHRNAQRSGNPASRARSFCRWSMLRSVLDLQRDRSDGECRRASATMIAYVVVCRSAATASASSWTAILHTEEIVGEADLLQAPAHVGLFGRHHPRRWLGDPRSSNRQASRAARSMEAASREATAPSRCRTSPAELAASAERSLPAALPRRRRRSQGDPAGLHSAASRSSTVRRIEDAGGKAVVQYQGRLMPILGYMGRTAGLV